MKSATFKWLIIALGFLATALVGFVFLTIALQRNVAELKTVMQTIANEQILRQDQQTLATVLADTAPVRSELDSYVIRGDDGTVAFLSMIDQKAAAFRVRLSTSQLEVVPATESPYESLVVTFSLAGAERDVRTLVRVFETLPFASEVNTVTFTRTSNEDTGTTDMSGSITLTLSITDV